MTKIMILNGPPRCGKDTAANAIAEHFGVDICSHVKFSQPLKHWAVEVIGQDITWLEENKDKELAHYSMTYRDAQIHIYNQMSTVFGTDWLGKHLINRIERHDQPYFVCSDGGRYDDIRALLREYEADELLIVQIMREGTSFAGDIRSYISAPNVRIRPSINRDLVTFKAELIDFAEEFFEE